MKYILTAAGLSLGLTILHGLSFVNPLVTKVELKPEWNGPDLKITYSCNLYEKLKGLHMESKGDKVVVNYGAFGRRGIGNNDFICLD